MNTRKSVLPALLLCGAAIALFAVGASRARSDEGDKHAKDESSQKPGEPKSTAKDQGAIKNDEHAKNTGEAKEPGKEEGKEEGKEAKELKFDAAARKKLGIELAEVEPATLQPEIAAIGILEDDPAETFTVRSPIAGYLRAGDSAWPAIGSTVTDGAVVGAVQPRLSPLEQFALTSQYVEAKSSVAELMAEVEASQASAESKRRLNADGKNVSDRQLEEAEAKLKQSQARLSAARAKLELLEQQKSAAQAGLPPLPVAADAGGVVVEMLSGPGEAVESGQVLLRLVKPGHLVARVELPIGVAWADNPYEVRVAAVGDEAHAMGVRLIGQAPRAGARTRGQTWLFAVESEDGRLAAGMPIVAHLPLPGQPLNGVIVPDEAIVRAGGLAWVFTMEEGDTFERHAVKLFSPTEHGWLVTEGLEDDANVVVRGAQVLLSEQMKAQIEAEAEATE